MVNISGSAKVVNGYHRTLCCSIPCGAGSFQRVVHSVHREVAEIALLLIALCVPAYRTFKSLTEVEVVDVQVIHRKAKSEPAA
jgi:hypothetical protein